MKRLLCSEIKCGFCSAPQQSAHPHRSGAPKALNCGTAIPRICASLTLRFDAILDGGARSEPPPPVTAEAAAEFDQRLKSVGFSLAGLQALTRNPTNPADPGARCRTVETSLLVAAGLHDDARRRILPPLLFPN